MGDDDRRPTEPHRRQRRGGKDRETCTTDETIESQIGCKNEKQEVDLKSISEHHMV
jgi:hypothetical protein